MVIRCDTKSFFVTAASRAKIRGAPAAVSNVTRTVATSTVSGSAVAKKVSVFSKLPTVPSTLVWKHSRVDHEHPREPKPV